MKFCIRYGLYKVDLCRMAQNLISISCGLGFLQLVTMQKEIQKQMTVMVAVPVAKEGKRMEGMYSLP